MMSHPDKKDGIAMLAALLIVAGFSIYVLYQIFKPEFIIPSSLESPKDVLVPPPDYVPEGIIDLPIRI